MLMDVFIRHVPIFSGMADIGVSPDRTPSPPVSLLIDWSIYSDENLQREIVRGMREFTRRHQEQ